MYEYWNKTLFGARTASSHFFRHVRRGRNTVCNDLATCGIFGFGYAEYGSLRLRHGPLQFIRAWFDGGCRKGVSGAGIFFEGARTRDASSGQPVWEPYLRLSIRVQNYGGSSEVAEFYAAGIALSGALELLHNKDLVVNSHCKLICKNEHASKVALAHEQFVLRETQNP